MVNEVDSKFTTKRLHSRSLEEENELVRSTKKVKDSHHAINKRRSMRDGESSYPPELSFKDKLVGKILRAYSQAFAFTDQMEADSDSNEEIEEIREGFASVCLSKETKQRIRAPWTNALIVKVFGKNVGYNYLHSKLLDLWKLTGRVDMVDFSRDFFLLRFSVDEDLEVVLKKGPWFVGGHFLSIQRWEVNFKPSEALVSSVAVWVKLNELPIEYYNAIVLRQIGQALGMILRVDMHTALEAKG
nr:uncharacterized protein CFP56_66724 [Quercus suber]